MTTAAKGRVVRTVEGIPPEALARDAATRQDVLDASRPCLKGYTLSVTVEDGYYLKAYANPPEGELVSWGFQATISRRGVRDSLIGLVTAFLEDNQDV